MRRQSGRPKQEGRGLGRLLLRRLAHLHDDADDVGQVVGDRDVGLGRALQRGWSTPGAGSCGRAGRCQARIFGVLMDERSHLLCKEQNEKLRLIVRFKLSTGAAAFGHCRCQKRRDDSCYR